MKRAFVTAAVVVVTGASWAMARGPDVSERMNAVEKQGNGTGSTTLALEQAAINRGATVRETPYMRDTAVPASAREPAAPAPATQPAPAPAPAPRSSW